MERGSRRSEDGESGQDCFATVDTDWLLMCEMSRPRGIRTSFPPGDAEAARQCLFAAVRRAGCEVVRISASDGVPLPAWGSVADEDV
ncbi:hypothetical protein GCM10027073_45250 [Streptomyces chlorus]|uniref:Uncharacterized protein n=1 Tax=Streptomyces chlorus TaxID=887452 RepID=A0ABW1E220_9ACTN